MTELEKELLKSKEKIEVPKTDGITFLNNIKQEANIDEMPKKSKKWPLILALSGSMAVIVALVAVIIGLNINNSNDKFIDGKYKIISTSNDTTIGKTDNTYIVKRWNEKTITEKYMSISYNDLYYQIGSSLHTKPTDKKYVGESLGVGEARGYDQYEQKQYTSSVAVYEILKVKTEVAVAIKFPDDDNYYSYCNFEYNFGNIGNFVTALNLLEYASFGTVYYDYIAKDNNYYNVQFDNVDNNAILNAFFSNKEETIYSDSFYNYSKKLYSMQFNVEALGLINLSLSIDINNIATTNLFAYGRHFNVGENAQSFLDYLNKNYEGYVLYYYKTNTPNTDDEPTKSDPSVTRIINE